VLVKKVIDFLAGMQSDEPERYRAFYSEFGRILREGTNSDFEHRESLAARLLFPSPQADATGGVTSLTEYIARMPESQSQIYYISGPNAASLARNPNLEIFRKRKLEVLHLTDPVDEIVLSQLGRFDGKEIVSVDSAELKLPEATAGETPADEPKPETSAGFEKLMTLFRAALGEKIADVRESSRLTDSPCCIVNKDGRMSTQLQKILSLQHEDFPMSEQILEVNPGSPLIQRLSTLAANDQNEAFLKDCALNLLDQALLVEGIAPDGPGLAQRMLAMMQELAGGKSAILT